MHRRNLVVLIVFAFLLLPAMVSSYEMPVQRPSCDPSAPATKIITSASDFDDINSSQYRVFCVRPGDYSSVSVRLSADGTESQPRYLVYDNPAGPGPNDEHPVKLSNSQRATLEELIFEDANWWVVQGLFIDGGQRLNPSGTGIDFLDSSSNNLIDRVVVQHGQGTLVQIEHGSSYNTLQNSVVRETDSDAANPSKDYHCIHIKGDKPGTLGNRIVRNEIYDCAGDGLHFSGCPYWLPNAHELRYDCDITEKSTRFWGDARGTIVYDNDIYITPDFKNVCGGSCSCLENAIDIKSTMGQTDPSTITSDDWVRIERNRSWNDCGANGAAIIAHYANTDYVLVRHNVIQKWRYAYRPTVKNDPFVDHHSVVGNVFADLESMTAVSKISRDLEFYKNTVVRVSDDGLNLSGYGDSDHLDLQCNAFVDAGGWSISTSKVHSDWNTFYDTPSFGSGANDQSFSSVADAKMEDLCFERKIWTGPETHCIANAQPTPDSPHLGHCPADLGSYGNVGVHDEVDSDFFTWFHEAPERTSPSDPNPQPDDWSFSEVEHFGDFENYQPIDLTRWTIAEVDGDRRLFLHTSDYQPRDEFPGELAVANGRTFEAFDLSVDVKTAEDLAQNPYADFVVVFGYEDASNYSMLLAHHQADITKLFRVENDTRTELANIDASMLPDDAWHTLRLVYRMGRLRVDFDGQTVWSGEFAGLPEGRVGLGSFDEAIYFDNLDVVTPAADPQEDAGVPSDADSSDAGSSDAGYPEPDVSADDDGGVADVGSDAQREDSTQMHGTVGCMSARGAGGAMSSAWWIALLLLAWGLLMRRRLREPSPRREHATRTA